MRKGSRTMCAFMRLMYLVVSGSTQTPFRLTASRYTALTFRACGMCSTWHRRLAICR